MNRKEAEALVGTRVSVWTSMNGQYVGELVQVAGSPWRGKVRLTGVTQVAAFEWSRGDRQRKGFRPGETIEVGGSSIRPAPTTAGTTYRDALIAELNAVARKLPDAAPKDFGWMARSVEVRQQQIDEEPP